MDHCFVKASKSEKKLQICLEMFCEFQRFLFNGFLQWAKHLICEYYEKQQNNNELSNRNSLLLKEIRLFRFGFLRCRFCKHFTSSFFCRFLFQKIINTKCRKNLLNTLSLEKAAHNNKIYPYGTQKLQFLYQNTNFMNRRSN